MTEHPAWLLTSEEIWEAVRRQHPLTECADDLREHSLGDIAARAQAQKLVKWIGLEGYKSMGWDDFKVKDWQTLAKEVGLQV